jgi:hypothetical protein
MLQILFLQGGEIATEHFLFHFQVKNAQKICHQKSKIKFRKLGVWNFPGQVVYI